MPERGGDLCSTCRKAPVCVKRNAAEEQPPGCPEYVHRGSTPEVRKPSDRPEQDQTSEDPPGGRLPGGLCSDCENRRDCCLAHTVEGGVWHCEEYR